MDMKIPHIGAGRDKWDARFMAMIRLISTWSSCYQENRKMGAILVRDRRILTTTSGLY